MLDMKKLERAFPQVSPGLTPLGARVIIQLRTFIERTESGIVLPEDTKEFNKANTQLGRIVSLGAIAFRNRDTGVIWREGVWARPGDFVRVPKWGGDRFERTIPGTKNKAIFCIFSDHEIIAKVDPEAFEELDEVL